MRNYIILNNQNSNTISGLIIQELAPISKPLQRTQVETIDGRDGDIVTPLGYAAYNKKIKIGLYGNFDINEVIAYFATKGTVIFSNEPDKYYYYQIVDQIDYERLVRYRVATVTMHVQPFKYSATEGTITIDSSDTVSDEGSDIALDGTAEAPFNVLRHKGNATQDGTPTPDNPIEIKVLTGDSTVKITGKNLLDTNRTLGAPSNTAGGATQKRTFKLNEYVIGIAANNNYDANRVSAHSVGVGTVTVTPTLSGYGLGIPVGVKAGATYALSCAASPTSGATWQVGYYAMDGTWLSQSGYSPTTITPPTGCTVAVIVFRPTAGTSYTFSNIQLELGSTATAYEPYKGQIYKLNFGKNLFDKDNIPTINNVYVDSTGQVAAGSGNRFTYIKLKPDTTYTITQGKKPSVNIRFALFSDVPALNSAGSLIGSTYSTAPIVLTFTTTKSNYYLGWSYANTEHLGDLTIDEILASIQLEAGSQATDYAAFKTPLELVAIGDYADEPVKVDGTWYIRRAIGKVVFDGTEDWASSAYGTNSWGLSYVIDCPYDTSKTQIISNIFRGCSNDDRSTAGDNVIYTTLANTFTIRNTTLSTKASVQSATNGNYIYYVLATPIDEAITDQDLIDALDELYDQAHSYKGHTHITATAADGNAPAVLAVDVNEDNESTVTNAGNTTSRPILTIYGQGDIGVYINDVEVLDVALGDEEYITLDSVEMEAYKNTTANLKNRLVTGDYSKLALNAGANKIRFTGKVTKYEISKYSRWL